MNNLKNNLTSLQEKAKERTVKTQTIEYDLETLVKKLEKGTVKLDPDYQRRHRWDDKTSSRLIESLILNIPIPIIYLSQDIDVDAESVESRYSVIDGQQRLTAVKRYFTNKFSLEGLESLIELNGCYYKDLPPFLIRRLEERTIKCLRIDSTLDSQVKIDIFERLNSGSVKLEPQELRNAVFTGRFNTLCKLLANNENFRRLLQVNPDAPDSNNRVRKMEDVEIVLRFFALIDGNYVNYKKSKDKGFMDFLSETMDKMKDIEEEEVERMANKFETTMKVIVKDLGDEAFAKFKVDDTGTTRLQSKFNVAVYDAIATSCQDLLFNENTKSFAGKRELLLNLFRDVEFYESVSGSYLDTTKLKYRIERAKEVLR